MNTAPLSEVPQAPDVRHLRAEGDIQQVASGQKMNVGPGMLQACKTLVLLLLLVPLVNCAAVIAALETKSPGDLLEEAQTASDEASALYTAGEYARAEPLFQRALTLREEALGWTHPVVAQTLNELAGLYQTQGLYARAEPLYQRALDLIKESRGRHHPDFASLLNNLALLYEAQGLYARAEPLFQRALALREEALGKNHPAVAASLDGLAGLYQAQGLYARAEPLYQRALALREEALGKNHREVAWTLNNLAVLYQDQGLYARAEPLYQRALALSEETLGKDHPSVAASLNNLAILYKDQGLYARAEPLFQRALALREKTLGTNHPAAISALNNLASLYGAQGLYARAEPLLERALALCEETLGKNHPCFAPLLGNLAGLYQAQGLYARAEPLYQRALALREKTLGTNHPAIITALSNLVSLYVAQGLYARAEPLLERALALSEETLGKKHPAVARTLNNLAILYKAQGLYARAEPLYQRALALSEETLGKNHPAVAETLNNLASLYEAQGLYARAEPLYQRALALSEETLGKNHPTVAQILNNLAGLYQAQGLYARAEPLYQRALALSEEMLGKNHPEVVTALNNLASLYVAQGLYARAEPLLERALALSEETLGKNHPTVAQTLNNLARLYVAQGLYARAEPLLERALALSEETFGKNHPTVAQTLDNLALTHLAQQRLTEALPLLTRAFALSERRLRQEALDFSESRRADFLRYLRPQEERLYGLLRAHPDDARVQRLALSAALLLKGRSLEETADISRTLYLRLSPRDRDTFEQLRGLRNQLATLSFQDPGARSPSDAAQRIQQLTDQGDALEADLARRSAPLRALTAFPSPSEIVDRVAASLPEGSALVEFLAYRDPLVPAMPGTAVSRPHRELRYLALVLRPDAGIRTVDLGPAEPIDLAASRLRTALANRDASFQATAQELHQRVFQPLLPLLGDTHHLFLSPDGQLGLVTFSALHDGHGFLVDSFDFTYLSSGRDLLPRPEGITPSRSVVVFADPNLSAPRPALPVPPGTGSAWAERSSALAPFFSTLRADVAQHPWTPLPGTRAEALAIQHLLPQAQLFLGAEASKERLMHLPPPGILHVATHGFFLEDDPAPEASRAVGHFGALTDKTRVPRSADPLLRSGLVLTGVSAPSSSAGADSALVTALELAGLDLWGTQLVVLSACDTGRGDVRLGQGVYGLHRAFIAAGAETVVMSLWKVNDETTRVLMESYYRNLLVGKGRAAALREAMLALRQTRPHPHYWAPFITLGQDAPLRSLAPRPEESTEKQHPLLTSPPSTRAATYAYRRDEGPVEGEGWSRWAEEGR